MDSALALAIASNVSRLARSLGGCALLSGCGVVQATEYLSSSEFVGASLGAQAEMRTLWLTKEHQRAARGILGHAYRGLRLRYWLSETRTAWIIGEIGKERPITIGVVIDNDRIEKVVILAYRESRGGEVRHPFFTGQFVGLFLREDGKLSARIDGIAGATLSVRSVSNVSRYALYLNRAIRSGRD